jgi:hypothetical protein
MSNICYKVCLDSVCDVCYEQGDCMKYIYNRYPDAKICLKCINELVSKQKIENVKIQQK